MITATLILTLAWLMVLVPVIAMIHSILKHL